MLRTLQGDCRERLKGLADGSVHCVVTSIPYFGLRDYGTATWEGGNESCRHTSIRLPDAGSKSATNKGASRDPIGRDCRLCGANRIDQQLGLEKTPAEYIEKMVAVFQEVRRVLRNDGNLWLNIGDSYCGYKGENYLRDKSNSNLQSKTNVPECHNIGTPQTSGFKNKDLMMIPARLAIALCDDGWYLRSEIVWSKPNPMPESVTDRPTRSHEMVYLLTKSARYFYDAEAIKEDANPSTQRRTNAPNARNVGDGIGMKYTDYEKQRYTVETRNRRSVWSIPTQPTPDAHFATFPEALVEPCILAGTSAYGCCSACGTPYTRILEPTEEYANCLAVIGQIKSKMMLKGAAISL